ncbi:3-hydroxyacyl-CoA dehyrogenase [Aspergillus eucalypticola CBS 122712]|uniref:3-hydroxyacyl-CoA dehyrogenase n=1 Tax=Aspergillus eucalypticola (strain CBS 122712 / IBT 29274) TaxID=1448314 RepID=A0A317UTS1_ASPEC|nr:3-hydroxyacyl-CoA dehyrogenase [Aspergillus eucalypticola CBS 122712]PWY65434.1 3-hydroxyacyl-CoA dehyrogenase [Aspergillus eucalypticola CBS 122712]
MSSSIQTVGVIGAGVIGASWTALFLAKGLKVIVTDPAPGAEAKLRDYLQEYCSEVPNATVAPGACLKNYTFVEDIEPYLGSLDLIQENGPERLDFKSRLFAQLDAKTPPHILIASSSSGLPSSEFVTGCSNNPSRILIGHPFNPPHLVPLVEVVPHPGTSRDYVTGAYKFYKSLDKEPVVVNQETPGFIANRLQAAICAEAYSLVSRGIVSAEDLDKTVTSGLGLRWALTGPIMTNTLGGGGDFTYFMDHLGPALKSWLDDMAMNQFDLGSEEQVNGLKKNVNGWISQVDLKKVEGNRDLLLANLVKSKLDQTANQ